MSNMIGRPFEKGVSGNKAGRPKGAKNKVVSKCLKALKGVNISYLEEDFQKDFAELSPRDRVFTFVELLKIIYDKSK